MAQFKADEAPVVAKSADPAVRAPLFYGWVIAAVAGLGMAAGVSVFLPTTIGLLIAPLGREFGWTAPQVLAALTFNTVATLVAAPLTGKLVDRLGARRVTSAALLCQALLIASFYVMNDNVIAFYLRYVLFALLATGTTAISYSALISRWFDRRRGLALGVALAGVGLGGVIWSVLAQYLFDLIGWRLTMLGFAAGLVLVILPIQLLALRDRPELMGLTVDGKVAEAKAQTGDSGEMAMSVTLATAIKTGRFWLVLVTFFLATASAYGVMLNLVTILVRQGVAPQTAANTQATIWLAILLGRVGTGWLLDRFFAPRVAFAFLMPGVIGIGMLAAGTTGAGSFAAAMLVGLAAGAEVDVLAYVVGRYFGLRHFGVIYAVNFGAVAIATSVGPVTTALVAAANGGSYGLALLMLMATLTLAGLLLLSFPRFPERFSASSHAA
ncbi:major facilitator superfamily mfs 1 [Novosphingobium sp. Rr 2-17]|uniref:MFS transporter n=1 Tax=Novosphingobium sp. Rr 2-17 TaxID=555793 RepID=UPI0002698EAA|nr:MFS transporter [Novosphingobium sp. Rr 2-17]EIZ80083.1 major facilitator superfamily mfs 1 [Novosphingobium sp. Rr 2-17]